MEIAASYIEDITGSFISVIREQYVKNLRANNNLTVEQKRELLKEFNANTYDLEPRLTDEFGFMLCTNGKFNATFNEFPKEDDKDNIFINLDCIILGYLGKGLEEIMPKGTKIRINADTNTSSISVLNQGKVVYKSEIVNIQNKEDEISR